MDYRIIRELDDALYKLQITAKRGRIPIDQYAKEQQSVIHLIKAIQNRTRKIEAMVDSVIDTFPIV